jgi:hypothetical protein
MAVCKIDQTPQKIYQHLSLQETPKFTQIGIFGLKIYHLATLRDQIETKLWKVDLQKR